MSKFRAYNVLVCPCGRYEGDGVCPTCGKPATRTLHVEEEPSITDQQVKELAEDMEPLLARAEKQDRWLHLIYFDMEFPPAKVNNLRISHAKLSRTLGRPARVWPDTPFYQRLCSSPTWVAEPKKNGWRCLACAGIRGDSLWSRHGRQIAKHDALRQALMEMDIAQIDGELMIKSGVLWAFDLLALDGESRLALPYSERRALLKEYIATTSEPELIRLVPSWEGRDKNCAYQTALEDGDEGIVFKRSDRAYPAGKKETLDWIKCRFSLLEREDVPSYM